MKCKEVEEALEDIERSVKKIRLVAKSELSTFEIETALAKLFAEFETKTKKFCKE